MCKTCNNLRYAPKRDLLRWPFQRNLEQSYNFLWNLACRSRLGSSFETPGSLLIDQSISRAEEFPADWDYFEQRINQAGFLREVGMLPRMGMSAVCMDDWKSPRFFSVEKDIIPLPPPPSVLSAMGLLAIVRKRDGRIVAIHVWSLVNLISPWPRSRVAALIYVLPFITWLSWDR